MKNRIEILVEKLMENEVSERPWTDLIVDFITKLLLVVRKDKILVVCNRLPKITYFVTTTERTSAKGLTRLFRDNMLKLYRLLEYIISDKGL